MVFVRKYGKDAMRELGLKGRKEVVRKYGPNPWKRFASRGGEKASKNKLGIFSDTNNEKRNQWRKIPHEKGIGIFNKKYDKERNKWRLKGLMNSPKLNVITSLGIKVRSRDEKTILEKLHDWGFDVTYEPCQIEAENKKWIVPDFGFKGLNNLYIEYLGRYDKSYWDYTIPRWKAVLKDSNSEFIIISKNKKKASSFFSKYDNVIGILGFGEWQALRKLISQLYLKRKQQ